MLLQGCSKLVCFSFSLCLDLISESNLRWRYFRVLITCCCCWLCCCKWQGRVYFTLYYTKCKSRIHCVSCYVTFFFFLVSSSRTDTSESRDRRVQQEFNIIFNCKTYMYWRVLWGENRSGDIQQHITSFSLLSINFESSCLHKLWVSKQISKQSLVSAETLTSSGLIEGAYFLVIFLS